MTVRKVVPPDRVLGGKGLSRTLKRDARALAEAYFSDENGPPPAARLDWLIEEIDDFVRHAGPRARLTFQGATKAVSALAPVAIGKLPPLRGLTLEDRVRAIEKFEATQLGLAALGAKAMLCIIYYEHPDAAREIGFDGKCMGDK